MNWITKNIFGFFSDLMSGILDQFGSVIGNIFETVADMNLNSSLVTNASSFTTLFAIALLGVMASKQVLDVYVFQTSGDADAEPLQLVVRVAQSLAVIGSSTWIFNELLALSKVFASDLLSSTHESDVSVHLLDLILQAGETVTEQSIGFLIALIMMLVGFIVFSIVAGIRAAQLTIMKILLPIFAVDLITTNRERWSNFMTECVKTVFYYTIQLVLFKLCCMQFVQIDYSGGLGTRFIVVIGLLVAMIGTPSFLEKFIFRSGVSNTTTSIARMAPMLLLRR